jgi:nucleotide-binding universal stress UspA family protein
VTGSTCQQVAIHADTSVLVVRGRPDPADGPVVVGHDGSAGATSVLEAAFAAAAARTSGLTVIRAFHKATPVLPADAAPPKVFNARTTQAALTDELTRLTRPLSDKYPDVDVKVVVADGDAAQLLVDVSHRAQLTVVGSRGHGGFTGLLLGSVGMHLIHHAHCPILIARG